MKQGKFISSLQKPVAGLYRSHKNAVYVLASFLWSFLRLSFHHLAFDPEFNILKHLQFMHPEN